MPCDLTVHSVSIVDIIVKFIRDMGGFVSRILGLCESLQRNTTCDGSLQLVLDPRGVIGGVIDWILGVIPCGIWNTASIVELYAIEVVRETKYNALQNGLWFERLLGMMILYN